MSQGLRLALLGSWAGMLLAIGLVAIPAAFQTLPGTELSARLVGAALPTLDQAGIVLALAAVGLGWLLAPTRWPGLRRLSDAAYRVFARNRLRWTGRQDACGGDSCEPRTNSAASGTR